MIIVVVAVVVVVVKITFIHEHWERSFLSWLFARSYIIAYIGEIDSRAHQVDDDIPCIQVYKLS